MKYQYNGATNNLDEIPDLEDKLERSIEDKDARDAGFKNYDELVAQLTKPRPPKGYWDKFVKQREKEAKIDNNIAEFGKNFQPHKQKQEPKIL